MTFQMLKIACNDGERFLAVQSTEITTALCCCYKVYTEILTDSYHSPVHRKNPDNLRIHHNDTQC